MDSKINWEYIILSDEYQDELSKKVTDKLNKGWECVGGISVSTCTLANGDFDITWAQAIKRWVGETVTV